MRILHISDLHIGKRLNEISLDEVIKNSLDQILIKIKELNVDCLLISGDIYDRALPSLEATNMVDLFINELIKLNIYVLIIPGNHDQAERLGYLKNVLKDFKIHIAIKNMEVITIDDYDFYLMPYLTLPELRLIYDKDYKTKDEAYKDIFNFEFKNKHNILLLHEYVNYELEESDSERQIIGGFEYVDYDIFKDFDYVALGHIHKSQKITDKMYYSGSIAKFSFSEEFNKNCMILIDDLKISRVYFNDLIKLVTIKGKLEDLINPEFYENYRIDKDIFRAIVTNNEELIGVAFKLKGIYKNLTNIEYTRTFETKSIKKEADKPFVDIVKDFFEYIDGSCLNDDELKVINDILLNVEE